MNILPNEMLANQANKLDEMAAAIKATEAAFNNALQDAKIALERAQSIHIRTTTLQAGYDNYQRLIRLNHYEWMRQIPPEVLGLILVEWNEDLLDPKIDRPDALIKYEARESPAVVASLVCKKWRAVVESTPELWTIVSVRFQFYVHLSLQRVNLAIERSKTCPLRVVIMGTGLEPAGQVAPVMNALNHTKPRWSELVITTTGPWRADILSYLQSPMPSLTSLFLAAHTEEKYETIKDQTSDKLFPANFIPSAPRLHTAYFEQVPPWTVNTPSLPQLTSFDVEFLGEITPFSSPKLLELVRGCPNLEHLRALKTYNHCHSGYDFQDGHPMITLSLPKLRSAHLDLSAFTAGRPFLDCPSLRNFTLSNSAAGAGCYLGEMLESLSLIQCDLDETEDLMTELHSMPNLKTLYIAEAEYLGDEFCMALMDPPRGNRGWVCPKLQSLRFEMLPCLVGDAVVRLLRSRSKSDSATNDLDDCHPQSAHQPPLPWLDLSVVKCENLQPWYLAEIDSWRQNRGLKSEHIHLFRTTLRRLFLLFIDWEPPEGSPTRGLQLRDSGLWSR